MVPVYLEPKIMDNLFSSEGPLRGPKKSKGERARICYGAQLIKDGNPPQDQERFFVENRKDTFGDHLSA